MNTDTQKPESTSRPFGYWLKAADRLMAAEFETAFETEHAGRRDWRLLSIIDGSVPAHRPLNGHKLHGQKLQRLVDRGWVIAEGDGWTLTDEGRAAKDRLGAIVDGIRAKVTDAVSDEEMATTLASLEKIARAFGWDEETPLPRGRRRGFGGRGPGFGRRFGGALGRGFGPGQGFGPGSRHGFGPDSDQREEECRHGERGQGHHGHPRHREHGQPENGHPGFRDDDHGDGHRGHGPHRAERAAQHAYERGFDAGFSRGRDA